MPDFTYPLYHLSFTFEKELTILISLVISFYLLDYGVGEHHFDPAAHTQRPSLPFKGAFYRLGLLLLDQVPSKHLQDPVVGFLFQHSLLFVLSH